MSRSLCLAMLCLTATVVHAADEPKRRTIKVSAQSQVFVDPNQVLIGFRLSNVNDEVVAAKKTNDELAKKVAKALAAEQLTAKEAKVVSYDIGPRYDRTRFLGYEVERGFEVRFSDFRKVDALLDALVHAAGDAISIDQVKFQVRDQRAAQVEARKLAVEYAHEKASHLAELNGVRLGGAISIEEDVEYDWDSDAQIGGFGGGLGASIERNPATHRIASSGSVFHAQGHVFQNRMRQDPNEQDDAAAAEHVAPPDADSLEKQLLLSPGLVDLNATVTIEYELLPK